MRACLLWLLAACGRIAFDGAPDAFGTVAPEANALAAPKLCNARTVGTVMLDAGEVIDRVRAVKLTTNGYAVALGTTSQNVHVIRLAADFTGFAQHTPLTGGYELSGLGQVADVVFVHVQEPDIAYVKVLDGTWDNFTVGDSTSETVFNDPPIVPWSATTAMRARISGGVLEVFEVDNTDTPSGITVGYMPASAFVTIGGSRVVTANATCETFRVTANGVAAEKHTVPGCSEPRVVELANGRGVLVHKTAAMKVNVYVVPTDPSATGQSATLGTVDALRITAIENIAWLVYKRGTTTELARYDENLGSATSVVTDVAPPYDLLPSALFWVAGSQLRVATPCLQ